MILADTSIWVDHLRNGDAHLASLLNGGQIVTHPFVVGEIALGHLRQRDLIVNMLLDLPRTGMANDEEVLGFIHQQALHGLGIGYVDAHLLAATRLTANVFLWTRDKKLRVAAAKLHLAAEYM